MLSAAVVEPAKNDSLQETYNLCIPAMQECKSPDDLVCIGLNLSNIKANDVLSESLRTEILKNKKHIFHAIIQIEIDTQSNEELKFIAEYISSLELAEKDLHILEKSNIRYTYAQRLMLLIEHLKGEHFWSLSLGGSDLEFQSTYRNLFPLLGALRFQILDLQATGLKNLNAEDLDQHLVLLENTGIACIDLSRNPIIEGEKLVTFATKWFSLNHASSKPHLKLDFSDALELEKRNTQSLIETIDQKTRFQLATSYYASYLLHRVYYIPIALLPHAHFKLTNEEINDLVPLLSMLSVTHAIKNKSESPGALKAISEALAFDSTMRSLWIKI